MVVAQLMILEQTVNSCALQVQVLSKAIHTTSQLQRNLQITLPMYKALIEELRQYKAVVLAFSGGVDSCFLAITLKQSGIKFIAVTVDTCFTTEEELNFAKDFCKIHGIDQRVITINVLSQEDIASNPENRCYNCKKAIFSELVAIAKNEGYEAVMDGTNKDDLGKYRPGIKALEELGIISPLKTFLKNQIRSNLKDLGLSVYSKESSPCLATRIPYNTRITKEDLVMIEKGEALLKSLGLNGIRLRKHGEIARIECSDSNIAFEMIDEKVIKQLKFLGFKFVTLDLEGYKQGCYDNK